MAHYFYKNIVMTIGKTIKELRVARKLTQLKLSILSGVDRKTISRVETGRHSPSWLTLRKIFSGLNLDAVDFYNNP